MCDLYFKIKIETGVGLKVINKDSKFWTSASSEKCPNEFGWCSSKELMDYDGLGFPRDNLDASKFCLTASLSASSLALNLKQDDCVNNRAKVICEVSHFYFYTHYT